MKSPKTAKAQINDTVFQVLLWVAAGVTILILLFITGYIFFKGFYFNNTPEYEVTDFEEQELIVDRPEVKSISFIVNKMVRAREITAEKLERLYTGDEDDWSDITLQNLKAFPLCYKKGDKLNLHNFPEIIQPSIEYSDTMIYVSSEDEMIEKVSKTPGAIGYLTSAKAPNSRKVKILPVRRIVLVANPSVLELQNNRRLQRLDSSSLKKILSGSVYNWQAIGGIDLPIKLIHQPAIKAAVGDSFTLSLDAIFTQTRAEFYSLLLSTKGAAGLSYYSDSKLNKAPLVKIARKESGLNLNLNFILERPMKAGKTGGISSIIINTVFLIILTLLVSAPLSIAAAIYLVEYARQGKIVTILRLGTETLAGIPSIIFGLFGYLFFVTILKFGMGLLSATLTITIMILPTIVRTSEEALKTVPNSMREGSLAIGATKWQTIKRVVLPSASPGILTGIILGIGRTVGETAALLFTMGSDYRMAKDLFSSARSLSLHLYFLVSEGISFERAFATATILISIILIVNFTTAKLIGRTNKLMGK
ncbi:MAG: phosphate ABC transporter permease PstA [Spirochaetota bacterium]